MPFCATHRQSDFPDVPGTMLGYKHRTLNDWKKPCHRKKISALFDLLTRLTKTLGELLGQSTEVVLHDLRQADSTIVAISNPQLTGRKIGDTLDNLGLHLFESHNFDDMANYETRTKTGKVLRSCSVFVRDDEGQAIGALCVNQDMSALLKLREWLDQALETNKPAEDVRTPITRWKTCSAS
jgi:predicted transcriptional regulator YheO